MDLGRVNQNDHFIAFYSPVIYQCGVQLGAKVVFDAGVPMLASTEPSSDFTWSSVKTEMASGMKTEEIDVTCHESGKLRPGESVSAEVLIYK